MRIGLGTAQFGLDYGITNKSGRVSEYDVSAILDLAEQAGITTLDTAPAYGESERLLGKYNAGNRFNVVTKTPKDCTYETLHRAFSRSFKRLGRIYALMVHDDALKGPNRSEVWHALEEIKGEGLVEKIGVSVYYESDIPDYPIDIIQLPFNPLDQRLLDSGHLKRLHDDGVEIHARSIFLQGLLLGYVPEHLAPIGTAAEEMRGGMDPMDWVIGTVFQCPYIAVFLCGVTSVKELAEVLYTAEKTDGGIVYPIRNRPPKLDPRYLNPALWQ